MLQLRNIHASVRAGRIVARSGSGQEIPLLCALSERQIAILLAGGLLNYTREARL